MSRKDRKAKEVQAALRQDPAPHIFSELAQVFQEHHARVVQAAYRVTGNATDAEDVLQNVFLRLLRRGVPSAQSTNLGSYLHRAAVNAAIDLLRSRKGRRKIPLEEVQSHLKEEHGPAPDEYQRARELREWLRGAISQLSPQAGEIFALRYLEGYGNREIAELVGTSPGVVAVVLHRTRNRLRDEIRSFLGGTS